MPVLLTDAQLPQLAKLAKTGSSLWNTGLKTLWSTLDTAKTFLNPPEQHQQPQPQQPSQGRSDSRSNALVHQNATEFAGDSGSVPLASVPMTVDGVAYKVDDEGVDENGAEENSTALWGRFPCCVSCVSVSLIHPICPSRRSR